MNTIIYNNNKNETIQQIEKDVLLLKESFEILNTLVIEQQEPIDTLEDFIQVSKENVKDAHKELLKAKEYQSNNNYLTYMSYITGTIVATLIIFIK